jgi:8-oxo-dGTP pyrophosphatase MutT (NUDIX family)
MTEHTFINTLRHNLRPIPDLHVRADAAVLMAIMPGPDPALLLTRRALHMNSHAGEVAFPGGKRDSTDLDLSMTALRESDEEVGLLPASVQVLGALKPVRSKAGLLVMPIVGLVSGEPELRPNPDEIESVFTVPLQFFFDVQPQRDHRINFRGFELVVSCFRYDDYVIWGLTARLIVDLMRQAFNHHIDYPWPPIVPAMFSPSGPAA